MLLSINNDDFSTGYLLMAYFWTNAVKKFKPYADFMEIP